MRASVARLPIALIAASWLMGLSGSTAHADEGWTITSFHSEIAIAADSKLTIAEDI
jgi:hypothetical protein